MSELGNRLRTAREAQGKSVADVAHQLLVRKTIIEALEENRFGDLPEATLTRGYIRRYAQTLGLDAETIVGLYPKSAIVDSPASRNLAAASKRTNPTVELPPKKARRRFPWPVVVPLVLLVGGALAWYVTGNRERFFPAANPPSIAQTPPAEPSPPVEPSTTTTQEPPPAPVEPKKIRLNLSTNPPGARIYLDGYQLKNPVNDLFEAGERELRIEAGGYQTYSETLRLVDDYSRVITLQVAPEAITPPTLNPDQVPGQVAGQAQPSQPGQAQPSQPGQAQPSQPGQAQPSQPGQAQPSQPGQAQPGQNGLVVRLEGSSWIQVISQGRVVYTGIPKPGTQLSYPLPASVRSGNAGVVRVLVNGKDQGPMGRVGQVVTRRYVAPAVTPSVP